jgi:predicted enzyme related to lactoylglutathione lyase
LCYVERAVSTGGSDALPAGDIAGIGRLAYIKDPDGNLLGLLQPGPSAS